MSTYVISDIHGSNKTFRKALKSVKLRKTDKLLLLGDLIDRGNDSKGVLDTVFLLKQHGFEVICLRGNHEQMLLDARNDITSKVNWLKNGGKNTLQSFLTSKLSLIPDKYFKFLETTITHLEIGKFIFVHAGINMTIEKPYEDEFSLLWLRDWKSVYSSKWLDDRKVIHGHSPMKKTEIKEQFNRDESVLCIDNGSFVKNREGYGSICVLRLDDLTLHFEKNIDYESS
jgi:serine/threonine protein phosphatase 1